MNKITYDNGMIVVGRSGNGKFEGKSGVGVGIHVRIDGPKSFQQNSSHLVEIFIFDRETGQKNFVQQTPAQISALVHASAAQIVPAIDNFTPINKKSSI